ncbi:MAG: ATP-dependent RNA helicase HrpA, partial [Pseudohongiellaceae bacterium]
RLPDFEILPLYARLRQSEQARIFKPHRGRRVVLATNVAETSLTVPGINYVIDTGLARISRYSLHSKVQRLPVEPVSQASANQRKGRCGRLAGGVCIRLYSEEDFNARPFYTDPEIRRTNLAAVILRMKFLGLGEPEAFPFLEPPEGKAINEGMKLLSELNALTPDKELTEAGRTMAQLPVDPRHARMLVMAAGESCLRELLIICSGLSIQDPREINAGNRSQAQEQLAEFDHPDSDFLTLANLFTAYEERRQALSQSQLRKYCKSHFLSFMRMREWREVHRQLLLACQQQGMRQSRGAASYEAVQRSIISGSLNQIACLQEGRLYQNSRNRKFTLFPGSVLARKQCKWIVTGELIETGQTFATLAAKIQPQWVEGMALHLVKREYYQPHWSSKRQEVLAYEKVQLYGLTLIENATVSYGAIAPEQARELFIREALAGDTIETRVGFIGRNRALLGELAREEEKIRRPDFYVSEREVFRFYDERLPAEVNSTRSLEQWLRRQGDRKGDCLVMQRQTLLGDKQTGDGAGAYPDQAAVRQNRLAIDYVFDPGSHKDGATLEVPVAILNQLTQADVDWAVPGLLREKCIALLKSLPKSMRKNFIPVSGFVDSILPQMSNADGDLIDALLAQISNHKRLRLSRADFAQADLPRHLQSKIKIIDETGAEQGFGHDVAELQQRFARQSRVA